MGVGTVQDEGRRVTRWPTMVAVGLLLLVLAAIVVGFVIFRHFSGAIAASNHRLSPSVRRQLAPSRSFLSHPQLMVVTFQGPSLFVRTDPHRRLISMLSVPSDAYVSAKGGGVKTLGHAYAAAGSAGVMRFVRSKLGLGANHVVLIEPAQIASLINAVGGVRIRDRTYALASGRAGNGEMKLNGVEARQYLENAEPSGSTLQKSTLLEAILTRLVSLSSFSRLTHLAYTVPKTVATDLSPKDLVALALLRLRVKRLVECGTAEGSSLASSSNEQVLRHFLGELPTRVQATRLLPRSGCRATGISSAGVPTAMISIAKSTVAIIPFFPTIALVVIALDLLMLLVLLRVPHRLAVAGSGFGGVVAVAGSGFRRAPVSVARALPLRRVAVLGRGAGRVGSRVFLLVHSWFVGLRLRTAAKLRSETGYAGEEQDLYLRPRRFAGVRDSFGSRLSSVDLSLGILVASLSILLGYLVSRLGS